MSRVSQPHVRFTVDEFFRLVESGALGTTRVELLNGRIYRLAPQATQHMAAISKINRALGQHVPSSEWLICQGTFRLNRFNAPDPDALWLPCPINTPTHLWPAPILLIEVSDTTYRKDSGIKLRTYAFHSVPEYWIVNLKADRVEVYRQPENPTGQLRDCRYASVAHVSRGASLSVIARPAITLEVDELLP